MMTEFTDTSHDMRYKSLSDLSVWNVGFEDCTPGWAYGPTIRPYYLIHFVRRGEGELQIGENIRSIHAGEAFLIPAEAVAWYQASKEHPWSYAWIGFMGSRAAGYFHRLMTASEGTYVLDLPDIERYGALIEKGAALDTANEANYFYVTGLLFQIFSYLEEDAAAFRKDRENLFSTVDKVKLYLDMKYTEKLKMEDVAKRFGLHPNYMTRAFREKFGTAPKKYLDSMKMQKACQLLAQTDMPVSLIAEAVGIEDALSFSRGFHARFGSSPRDYRKKTRRESGARSGGEPEGNSTDGAKTDGTG